MKLESSRALWNRSRLDLGSKEQIAQILDRGEIEAWRELYARARDDEQLRGRIAEVVATVPLDFGHFWLAALASLGHDVELGTDLPRDDGGV